MSISMYAFYISAATYLYFILYFIPSYHWLQYCHLLPFNKLLCKILFPHSLKFYWFLSVTSRWLWYPSSGSTLCVTVCTSTMYSVDYCSCVDHCIYGVFYRLLYPCGWMLTYYSALGLLVMSPFQLIFSWIKSGQTSVTSRCHSAGLPYPPPSRATGQSDWNGGIGLWLHRLINISGHSWGSSFGAGFSSIGSGMHNNKKWVPLPSDLTQRALTDMGDYYKYSSK